MDEERRWQIPLLLAGMLVLVAGSRFDGTRPMLAAVLAFGFPVLSIGLAIAPFRDSTVALRNLAFALGALAALAAEARIARAWGVAPPAVAALARMDALVWLLIASAIAGALVQAVAAHRGMRTFVAAWLAMVAALAIYLPGHFEPTKEALGQVIAALLFSLVVGGGPGLLGGAAVSALAKRL